MSTNPPVNSKGVLDLDAKLRIDFGVPETIPDKKIRIAHKIWTFHGRVTGKMMNDLSEALVAGQVQQALSIILKRTNDAPKLIAALEANYRYQDVEEAFFQIIETATDTEIPRARDIANLIRQQVENETGETAPADTHPEPAEPENSEAQIQHDGEPTAGDHGSQHDGETGETPAPK